MRLSNGLSCLKAAETVGYQEMPMIIVRYVAYQAAADLRTHVAAAAEEVAARTLGKLREVTVVLAEEVDRATWFVGGMPLAPGAAAFWLQIAVTAGTNTKAESAAFVREAFQAMEQLLGPVDERSYVLVQAADGDGYGYGGLTQNARWANAQAR